MSTKFSQFISAGMPRTTDIVVGLRSADNTQFKTLTGFADSLGSPIVEWIPGVGPNVNYVTITSSITGNAPIVGSAGSDPNIGLIITPQGAGQVVVSGTNAIQIPSGTTAQRPSGVAGDIRTNTTTGFLEFWNPIDAAWEFSGTSALANLTFYTETDGTAVAPNSIPMSGKASGFVSNTTATGVLNPRTLTGTSNQVSISNGTGVSGDPVFSIPSTFIAPGTLAAVTSISAPEYLLTGSGSGTISILPQAAAGTYNFNLPITAGTSGYVLTSAGGGGSAMTWTNLGSATVTSIAGTANEITASASTGAVTLSIPSTFIAPGTIKATTSSAAVSFLVNGSTDGVITVIGQAHAGTYEFDLPTTAGTSGYVLTSAGGAGSPMTWTNPSSIGGVNSVTGTTNQITASPTTGAVVLTIPSTFIAPGTIAAVTSVSTPSYLLTGAGSGTISILPQSAAGTYNFNLPITAGTSGYVLTSAGGGSAAMTWTNLGSAAVTSITGTANEITASASTGAVTLSTPSTFIAPGTIQATTSSAATSFLLNGSTDGVITIKGQAHAGTYEFDLPTTAGTSGYLLTSAGGAGAPMTWTSQASITGIGTLAGDSGSATGSTVTISGGTTGLTTSASSATMNLTGTLIVGNGGTGRAVTVAYMPICGGTSTTSAMQSVSISGASAGYVLTYVSSSALPTWQAAGGGGGGTAVTNTITASNTFAVGNVVYLNGTTYTLAEANSVAAAEAVGIVTTASGSAFTITTSGYITGLSGLTAGVVYWLSDGTPGLLTSTMPTTVGNVAKPMLVADTTTSGYMINYRGEVISTSVTTPFSPTIGGTGIANLAANTITFSGNYGLTLTLTGATSVTLPTSGTLATTSQLLTIVNQTTSSVTLAANSEYYINDGGNLVTLTLPATAAVGDTYSIVGQSSGGWIIAQASGQRIYSNSNHTTTTSGTLASTNQYNSVVIKCIVANTTFSAVQINGSLTIV